MDLTEADDIKMWQEYTEEQYKKDLHDPDNHDGVITHLEPDILECEVKWALGSVTMNKARQCILSPCLFNLYAEYIMRNAGLDEAQDGIKIAGRVPNPEPHSHLTPHIISLDPPRGRVNSWIGNSCTPVADSCQCMAKPIQYCKVK